MYDTGEGVAADHAVAVDWYRKAAEKGHAQAQHNLGVSYDEGEGVALDDAQAAHWYRKAAEQGHAESQHNLARDVRRRRERAEGLHGESARWYRKAAEQGFAQSQHNLGVAYSSGEGVVESTVTAYAWLTLALNAGHKQSAAALQSLESNLSAEQKQLALKLAREWKAGESIPDVASDDR